MNRNSAAVQLDQALGNHQTQSTTTGPLDYFVPRPEEAFKHMFPLLNSHSHAGVANLYLHRIIDAAYFDTSPPSTVYL